MVQNAEFQQALLGVMAFCHAPLTTPRFKSARRCLKRGVGARLARLHAAAKHDAKRFGRLSPERKHRVRKRLKRLSYLAEFATPLFGADRVERYLKR